MTTMTNPSVYQSQFSFNNESVVQLINVVHRRPSWQAVIKGADVVVRGAKCNAEDKRTTRPRSNLLPEEWHERFNKIHTRVQHVLDQKTLPFSLPGVRQVPSHIADDVMEPLNDIRQEQKDTVLDLINHYDEVVAWNRNYWDTHGGFQLIAGSLYRRESLMSRYAIEVQSIVLGKGTDESLLVEGVRNLVLGPRNQLVEALDKLKDLISADGKVTAKSFRAINRAIDLYRTFGEIPGIADKELDRRIEKLQELVDETPKATDFAKGTPESRSLLKLVEQVSDICRDEATNNDLVVSFGADRLISV